MPVNSTTMGAPEFCDTTTMPMTMLMMGFATSWDASWGCLIFLFQNYEINSVASLIGSYALTLLLGLLEHGVDYGRKVIRRRTDSELVSFTLLHSVLYGIKLSCAFLLMLIAMTCVVCVCFFFSVSCEKERLRAKTTWCAVCVKSRCVDGPCLPCSLVLHALCRYRTDMFVAVILASAIGHVVFHGQVCCKMCCRQCELDQCVPRKQASDDSLNTKLLKKASTGGGFDDEDVGDACCASN